MNGGKYIVSLRETWCGIGGERKSIWRYAHVFGRSSIFWEPQAINATQMPIDQAYALIDIDVVGRNRRSGCNHAGRGGRCDMCGNTRPNQGCGMCGEHVAGVETHETRISEGETRIQIYKRDYYISRAYVW